MVPAVWKWRHIIKGILTWIPPLNTWRQRRISTGGTNNARYCYSVWLRHLLTLHKLGFEIKGARVGELGPGESIGTGLAALLSGADHYIGLDILPFLGKVDVTAIFEELVTLYERKEPIPDEIEFPRVSPKLPSYQFPDHLIDWTGFQRKKERIRAELACGLHRNGMIRYQAPWNSVDDVVSGSLDLVFSQAVLEYSASLNDMYRAMFVWLKQRGYACHVIDFSAHGLSPLWNGHWAYSDLEWSLAKGRREVFLNREALSDHIACATKFGFKPVLVTKECRRDGLKRAHLARRFRQLHGDDLQTRGAVLVFRKMLDG